jgi:hypothetical protein
MHARRRLLQSIALLTALVVVALVPSNAARGDVIVLANRIDRALPVRFTPVAGVAQQVMIPPGDVVPLFLDGKGHVEFSSPGAPKRYLLDANCAYYIGRASDGRIDLQKIGLGEDGTAMQGRSLPGSATGAQSVTIGVKILVDEEEPARRAHWERRLRRRIEAASAILEKCCRVRLQVVAVETWNSDNSINDLHGSLAEFEREVAPSPARVAIGFTGQYQVVRGRTHMAGTRGPLHSHILVREGSPEISEPEKLEFLVHELGHFLGASHSPERGSVMRPVLGDNRAGRSDFRIQFDPVNALVVAMIGEEMRRSRITRISDLEADTKRRLRQIYTELARSLPDDPAGFHYMQLIGSASATPLAESTRHVLQEIVRAAVANRAIPAASDGGVAVQSRRTGDDLTEYYVRQAARAADALPNDVAPRAFLLALAVGLDDSQALAAVPGLAEITSAVEAPSARATRLTLLGEPTLHERRDMAQHFFISAYLTSAMGTEAAHAAGVAKELLDAQGDSGFSFADIAADRAGARFAGGVLKNRFPLSVLAQSFTVAAFMPEVKGLPEGFSSAQFKSKYGTKSDPRFNKQIKEIDRRILVLPPYRPAESNLRLTP